jgi:hypothetical protein
MTAQIKDGFRYRKKSHSLAGINGSGLFDPAQHKIMPVAHSTNCWRGYYCTYEVEGRALLLTEVHLGLGKKDEVAAARGEGPLLFGKVPRRYTEHGERRDWSTGEVTTSWESSYFKIDGIREPIPFTGGLLIGDDFIREMYFYTVFQPACTFRTVHELMFDSGRLIEEHNRSAQMAEFREMISSRRLKPGSQASEAEIEEWARRCSSLEYKAQL